MVEVFKTDVREGHQASQLRELLQQHFPGSTVSFDLDDCDPDASGELKENELYLKK